MDTRTILTLDLGRFNSVLCWYDPVTRAAEYATVRTLPEDIELALLRDPVALVVFEAPLPGWLGSRSL